MRFWGITGTNGKTTTTWIFAAFVNACPGRKCGYLTTVEVNTGTRRFYTGYTTPPLAQLREIFAEMEANGCTDCVMEVSSHAIHQHRTGETVFAGGAFTNLSEDHLDYHKTMAAYFDVKLDFARQIAEQQKGTRAKQQDARAAERVSEAERAELRAKQQDARAAERVSEAERAELRARQQDARAAERVSEAERAELRAPYIVCLDGGYGREMFAAVGRLPLNAIPVSLADTAYDLGPLPLVGAYNKSNVLTAAALAEAAGVPRETIQRVIPTLTPRWGRLERIENPRVKATVYVDFAHTPDGLEKVLTAVRDEMAEAVRSETDGADGGGRPKTADLWVVFGAGGDRDPMKRPPMGAAAARLADRLVVTSDNPRSEDPMKIIGAILDGVRAVRPPRAGADESVFVEPDRAKAIAFALARAQTGDIVVVAGKGHETTQEIAGVRHPFDDRSVVRDWRG